MKHTQTDRSEKPVARIGVLGEHVGTGTPPGGGSASTPPAHHKPGDVMELGVGQLGTQRRHVLVPR
ncbi:fumarylacetoacetate hydrolase family protein [Streptomyces sp. NPDC001815]|uniref:fumarylacetoacetate hydrolase family protein n=1 Tax=Streptomyces sp. NPDC001815 TaxID=3154526 RepID=UPI0033312DC1